MDCSFDRTEWKPLASAGNHSQVSLPLIGEVPRPQLLDGFVLRKASFNGVLNHAVMSSGREHQDIADEIHISAGYMSRFMQGVAQQWAKRLVAFMRATNSLAPLQWISDQMGCDVVVRHVAAAELAQAREKLAELERRYA